MSVRYDVKKAVTRSILGRFRAARMSAATRPTLHPDGETETHSNQILDHYLHQEVLR